MTQFNLKNYPNTKIILTDKYIIFIGPLGILKKKTNFFNINVLQHQLLINNTDFTNLFKYICDDTLKNKTKLNLINLNSPINTNLQKQGLNTYLQTLNKDLQGIVNNYSIILKLNGVGFKYSFENNNTLILRLGYSHYITYTLPKNIYIKQLSETELMLLSNDYNLLHKTAAKIRNFKKPNFYKGNGILYNDEIIILKKQKANKK